ncbi:MAG: M67 family metallopeptidase, partial [Chloroflexi bacterium]
MTLRVPAPVMDRMREHLEAGYPQEACGALIGSAEDAVYRVTDFRPMRNTITDRPRDRYALDPLEQLQVQKDAEARGLEIIGFAHSHPDHPPVPSRFDADHAWTFYSYVGGGARRGLAAGRGRSGVDGGRPRILAGAARVAGEPAVWRLEDGDVDPGGASGAEIENDVGDHPRVARWQGLGRNRPRLITVLASAQRLSLLERIGVELLGQPVRHRATVVLSAGAAGRAARRIQDSRDDGAAVGIE